MVSGILAIMIGSVLGAAARAISSPSVITRRFGEAFPWGTVTINVTGAFLIGILGALATRIPARYSLRPIPGYSR